MISALSVDSQLLIRLSNSYSKDKRSLRLLLKNKKKPRKPRVRSPLLKDRKNLKLTLMTTSTCQRN
jgi:hypothetical protein